MIDPPKRIRSRTTAVVVTFAVAATLGISACNQTTDPERWCERDTGDVLVDNSYCEQGVQGYEWEPDHDQPKKYKKPSKASKTGPPTTRSESPKRPTPTRTR